MPLVPWVPLVVSEEYWAVQPHNSRHTLAFHISMSQMVPPALLVVGATDGGATDGGATVGGATVGAGGKSRWESSSCCLFSRQRCRLHGCCQLFKAIIDSLNHLLIAFTKFSMDGLQSLFGRRRSGQKFVDKGFDTGVWLLFGASNLPFQVLEWTEYLLKLGQLVFGSNFVAMHVLC